MISVNPYDYVRCKIGTVKRKIEEIENYILNIG